MFETVKIEGNKEYYYNADNKLVSRFADETKDYRTNELTYKVNEQLQRARAIYRYPSKELIDSVIEMQKESTEKAARYVNYKLIGECNYLDVFGHDFKAEIQRDNIEKRLEAIERAILELKSETTGIKNNYYGQLASAAAKRF